MRMRPTKRRNQRGARWRTYLGPTFLLLWLRRFLLPERGDRMLKTDTLRIRITPEEKATAARLAARERLSTSAWVRDMIRQNARTCGLWPPEIVARQGQSMP